MWKLVVLSLLLAFVLRIVAKYEFSTMTPKELLIASLKKEYPTRVKISVITWFLSCVVTFVAIIIWIIKM